MILLLLPYFIGVMGAGDVKLMGVVGAIMGPKGALVALILSTLAGGIYGLIVLVVKRRECRKGIFRYFTMLKTFAVTGQLNLVPAGKDEKGPKLCYGVAIAAGTLLSVFFEFSGYMFPI
jgi:prepilin peptidase CpaA